MTPAGPLQRDVAADHVDDVESRLDLSDSVTSHPAMVGRTDRRPARGASGGFVVRATLYTL